MSGEHRISQACYKLYEFWDKNKFFRHVLDLLFLLVRIFSYLVRIKWASRLTQKFVKQVLILWISRRTPKFVRRTISNEFEIYYSRSPWFVRHMFQICEPQDLNTIFISQFQFFINPEVNTKIWTFMANVGVNFELHKVRACLKNFGVSLGIHKIWTCLKNVGFSDKCWCL